MSYFGNSNSAKGNENGNITTQTESVINASGTLTMNSGKDTNIDGSKVKGDKVVADIKGDLNIASRQDTDNYTENNKSTGFGLSTEKAGGKPLDPPGTYGPINKATTTTNGTASSSKEKIDSTYASVTDQAGIFAGKEGFDIQVGKNTDLKGAVISSDATPDKNKLSTDTLTFSDMENRAKYNSSSKGVNYNSKPTPGMKLGDLGLTPDIGTVINGDANSTTKSAISNGTIEVRSNPNMDLSNLSRDTTNSLNTLGKIFDKQTVKEKQELVGLFGELAAEEIHKLSVDNGWEDGDPKKVALHTVLGSLMSQMSGGNAFAGGFSAGLNEALQKELANIPDLALRQWVSYVIGSTASKITGGNPQTGGSITANGTKNNDEGSIILGSVTIAGIGEIIVTSTEITVGSLVYKAGTELYEWAYGKYVSYKADKAVDKVLEDATPGRETKGKTDQYEKTGGYDQAVDDFDSLGVENVKDIPSGKTGKLADGRNVNVRVDSSDGRPTLEIMNKNGTRTKVRYND